MTELPLFYRSVVPLDRTIHRGLALADPQRFGFTRASHFVPAEGGHTQAHARHGLLAVNEPGLAALPADSLARLHTEGWLAPIYAHLVSLQSLADFAMPFMAPGHGQYPVIPHPAAIVSRSHRMIPSRPSSHHASVLRRLARAATVGALLLNAATGAAQAGTDKPSAAPAPVPAEPGATTASFGDWVLRCQRVGEARLCEVGQAMQVQGQAAPIAQVAIGRLTTSEPLRITAVLPVSVLFPGSVQIQSEDKPGEKAIVPTLHLAWRRCLPGGCFADAPIPEDQLQRWHGFGGSVRITFKDAAGRDVAIPLSLRGLGPALDALGREKS